MKKILLYSGGMDSWLIDKLWHPDTKLYINLHTKYSDEEMKRLPKDVDIIDFPFLKDYVLPNSIIPLRNLYLLMIACNITENDDIEICLGATAGDRVLDKSEDFVKKANEILNYLYQPQWWIPEGKKIRVNIDFKSKTKEELLQIFLAQGGDINEAFNSSFSCYDPKENGEPCWNCKPCFRKFVAFESVGYKFSDDVLKKVIPYIYKEIVPQIMRGNYNRGEKEEKAILECVEKYREYI